MKLYTYFPSAGLETLEAHETPTGAEIEHEFAGLSARMRVHHDAIDDGEVYFTTPERGIRAFIERGEARLADKRAKLTRPDRRDWRAALAKARKLLERMCG